MSLEENKTVIRRAINEIVNQKKSEIADELISPNFTRSYGSGTHAGPEAYKQLIQWLHATIANVEYSIDEMIAENDRVMIRVTARGIHQGIYAGIPGTGKAITFSEVFIYKMEDGKIASLWGCVNQLDILKQVGARILPPEL